jgi:uncharacterized protein YozE (UPF0346 family)
MNDRNREAVQLAKSFYHFLLKFRASTKANDEIAEFANAAYEDHSFPKHSTDYYELTNYLELNGLYLQSMSTFDRVWEIYKQNG